MTTGEVRFLVGMLLGGLAYLGIGAAMSCSAHVDVDATVHGVPDAIAVELPGCGGDAGDASLLSRLLETVIQDTDAGVVQ